MCKGARRGGGRLRRRLHLLPLAIARGFSGRCAGPAVAFAGRDELAQREARVSAEHLPARRWSPGRRASLAARLLVRNGRGSGVGKRAQAGTEGSDVAVLVREAEEGSALPCLT